MLGNYFEITLKNCTFLNWSLSRRVKSIFVLKNVTKNDDGHKILVWVVKGRLVWVCLSTAKKTNL